MDMHKGWITLHDVAGDLGIVLSNTQAWTVGADIRNRYQRVTGLVPPKDNRTKKAGIGSHCFALYPPAWRAEIVAAIRSADPETSPQEDLFKPPRP
jgi:hypothetical protein